MKRKGKLASALGCRTIAFLAARNSQILDVAGPFQIFIRAAEYAAQRRPDQARPYRVVLLSADQPQAVRTNCGLVLAGAVHYRKFREPIDTLLVVGGTGLEEAGADQRLTKWVRGTASHARRFGSICTGAFLLASAGLLDGRQVTTHWKWADSLAQKCAQTRVDPDPIYIRDGSLYTSAGITAGMDLALALVQEDLGATVALEVARDLVMFLRRSGSQSQFSSMLKLQASDRNEIEMIRSWIIEHIANDMSVEQLAERTRMSPRNFARVFVKETGLTPAEFVEKVRVEAARRRLEESSDKLEKIAADCGFGTAASLRRSFQRVMKVMPSDYRERFTTLPERKRQRAAGH